jgi:hypothetical protein
MFNFSIGAVPSPEIDRTSTSINALLLLAF